MILLKKSNLTTGKPFNTILLFALPMILSVTLQQLYNVCDSLIAGKMIDEFALASINASYPVTMIFLAFATGFGVGANIICAKYVGEDSKKYVKETIYTSLISITFIAIIIGSIGFLITDGLLELLNCNSVIFDDASTYLKFYCIGMLFLFIYNCVTSLFQSLGNSKIPLYLLIFSTTLNIILDILFVKSMGVYGIALATLIAQGIASTFSCIILLIYVNKNFPGKVKCFNKAILLKILPVAIPSIVQASIISLGNIAVQSLINQFDPASIAGYGAAYKICYVIVNIYTTMSNAISTYTSQNAGAEKYDRIKKGYYSGLTICIILTIITTITFLIIPNQLLSIFANDAADANVFNVGRKFIYCVAPFYILLCLKIPCDGVLKGSKDMISFMISTFMDLIIRVGLSFIFFYTFPNDQKIIGIFISWPIGWAVGMLLSQSFFFIGRWKKLIGYKENSKIAL